MDYQVGDLITMHIPRSWIDIWLDRITSRRWDVPRTAPLTFKCTSMAPGAVWPMVDDQAGMTSS